MIATKPRGQGLSEYSLAISLIAIASIGALSLLGSTVSNALGSFHTNINQPPPGALAQLPPSLSTDLTYSSSALGHPSQQGNNNASLAQAPGLGGLTSMTTANIETSGANGATEMLALTLDQKIDQWQQSGKITEQEANQLRELSQEGHAVASHMAAFEEAFVTGKSTYMYQGKMYKVQEDVYFGVANGGTPQQFVSMDPAYVAKGLLPLANEFQKVKELPIFKDPEIAAEVTRMTQEIGIITEAMSYSAGGVPNQGTISENTQQLREQLATTFASYAQFAQPASGTSGSGLAENNAGEICKLGNGNSKKTCK